MKKSFENQYLSFLKDVFNEKKSHAIFFSPDSGEPYELDVLKMSVDIQKLDPGLINVVIEKGIKMRDLSNSSMQNLLKELAQDEKGAVVCWNDKNGNQIYFANAGINPHTGNPRVIFVNNKLAKFPVETVKQTLFHGILKNDVKNLYNQQRLALNNPKPPLQGFPAENTSLKDNTSSAFEKNFKELIKLQGLNASPVDTARLLVLTMPASERLQLEKTLPKKDSEIEGLLAQWKTDALPPERPRQIQRPQQKKDALSLTR